MISSKILMSRACLFLIQTLAMARMLAPSRPVGQSYSGDSCANSGSPTVPSADAQLKVYIQLCQIFKLCSVNDKCLYDFKSTKFIKTISKHYVMY